MDAVVFLRDVPLEPVSVDLIPHLIHILRFAGHRVRWQPDPGCLFVDSPLEGRTIGGKVCGEENGMAAQTLAELFRWVRMAGGVAISTPPHRTDVQVRILTEPCDKGDHPSILVISGRKRWFSWKPSLAEMVADSLRGAVDLPVGIVADRSARSTEVQIHLKAPLDDQIPRATARAIWLALMTRYGSRQRGGRPSSAAALQAMGLVDRLPPRVRAEAVRLEKGRTEKIGRYKEPAAKVAGEAPPLPAEANTAPAAREASPSVGREAPQTGRRRAGGRARSRQLPDPVSGWRPRVVWESEGLDPFPYTVEGPGSGPGFGVPAVRERAADPTIPALPNEPSQPPGQSVPEVPTPPAVEVAAASRVPFEPAATAPAKQGAAEPAVTAPAAGAAPATPAAPPASPAAAAPTPPAAPATATAPAIAAAITPASPAAAPATSATPLASTAAAAATPAAQPASPAAAPATPAAAPASTAATPTPAATPAAAETPAAGAAPAAPLAAAPLAAAPLAAAPLAAAPLAAAPATDAALTLAATPTAAAAPTTPAERAAAAAPVTSTVPAAAAASESGTAHLTALMSDPDIQQRSRSVAERSPESTAAVLAAESTRVSVAVDPQTYRFKSASRAKAKAVHH